MTISIAFCCYSVCAGCLEIPKSIRRSVASSLITIEPLHPSMSMFHLNTFASYYVLRDDEATTTMQGSVQSPTCGFTVTRACMFASFTANRTITLCTLCCDAAHGRCSYLVHECEPSLSWSRLARRGTCSLHLALVCLCWQIYVACNASRNASRPAACTSGNAPEDVQ